ncbi:hypothetical protein EV177_002611 [Coemansia sp. RSA 1804]|nr:hypothetical protein EV177_002611 [Coemansia sp. RSA 1804]
MRSRSLRIRMRTEAVRAQHLVSIHLLMTRCWAFGQKLSDRANRTSTAGLAMVRVCAVIVVLPPEIVAATSAAVLGGSTAWRELSAAVAAIADRLSMPIGRVATRSRSTIWMARPIPSTRFVFVVWPIA